MSIAPLSPSELRKLFPALGRFTWFNAAASSPICAPVAEAMRAHLDELVSQGDLGFPRWLEFKEATRARVAQFINASKPSEIGFVPSTSVGFSVVAHLLEGRGVREVLTLEGEFPSTTLPLLQAGLALRVVRRAPDGSYPLQAIADSLTPNTGAIALSAVQYASGFRADLAGISALAKSRGIPLAINAAQALGQIPLDVRALNADFLCAPSHKWMMGGYGLGMLYARDGWISPEHLPFAGWLSVDDSLLWNTLAGATRSEEAATAFTAHGAQFKPNATAVEAGGSAWVTFFGLSAALELISRVGMNVAEPHIAALQSQLRAGLRSLGFRPNAPDDQSSGICVVPVQGNPSAAVSALLQHGITTTARGGGLRLSTHVFNDASDVAKLLEVLPRAAVRPA